MPTVAAGLDRLVHASAARRGRPRLAGRGTHRPSAGATPARCSRTARAWPCSGSVRGCDTAERRDVPPGLVVRHDEDGPVRPGRSAARRPAAAGAPGRAALRCAAGSTRRGRSRPARRHRHARASRTRSSTLLDHLLDVEAGRVDRVRVGGRGELRRVAAVALGDRELDLGRRDPELGGPPAGPLGHRRREVDLDLGVGTHTRPGIAPLEHRVSGELALARPHPLAHGLVARDGAHVGRDPLRAQVDRRGRARADERGERRRVVEVDAALERDRRQLAVHLAGVDVPVAEPLRHGPRHGALARAGRAVDRHHHGVRRSPRRGGPRSRGS